MPSTSFTSLIDALTAIGNGSAERRHFTTYPLLGDYFEGYVWRPYGVSRIARGTSCIIALQHEDGGALMTLLSEYGNLQLHARPDTIEIDTRRDFAILSEPNANETYLTLVLRVAAEKQHHSPQGR